MDIKKEFREISTLTLSNLDPEVVSHTNDVTLTALLWATCVCIILFKMADSIKENVKGSELEADEKLEEGDKVLIAQAIALSLSGDSTEQGGEINSPFNSEPKIIDDNWQGPTTLFLGQLQEMGFSKNACIKVILYIFY
jgi:hypothetical protein